MNKCLNKIQFCLEPVRISHVTALVSMSLRLEEEGPVIFMALCLFLSVAESNMKQNEVCLTRCGN